jgi:hypothetical protein
MNYFDYQDRRTRKREVVQEEPEPDEPIEVKEDPLSETGVVRFLKRIAGRIPR